MCAPPPICKKIYVCPPQSVIASYGPASNNSLENMPANDWSEHWMKTVSGRKGERQEQLCQIDWESVLCCW